MNDRGEPGSFGKRDKLGPYTLSAVLHRGDETALFRGRRTSDDRPVLVEVLEAGDGNEEASRLRRAFEMGKTLDGAIVAAPLAFEKHHGVHALVMEDMGGEPLDGLIRMAPGGRLGIEPFLRMAAAITGALAELHRRGVIHRDIKPESILVEPSTCEVRFLNLGIATRLPCTHISARSPRQIEGSLPYMSPEQTGRVNRGTDSRTDLYSLGVTFYEMLTGELPFEAHGPLEWIHCHVARLPPQVTDLAPDVPEPVARIVEMLLQKAASERYQTASGLQHDLLVCLEQWKARGRIEPFPLGARDVPDRLRLPQKLHGRQAETRLLVSAFERVVATGKTELAVVHGYSGIGKSSLVHELYAPVVRERGRFLSGKFDQYERGMPLHNVVMALRDLLLEVLSESDEMIAEMRQRLSAALGVNAQLIIDVIPLLELVIGKQPPVPAVPPAEAQNRFKMVFRRFVGVFAHKEHPLVLFLDDLQWADTASLGLLLDLATHPDVHHLFIVGAYRDNEVGPAHALTSMLLDAGRAGVRSLDITLGPLAPPELAVFVADVLGARPEDVRPLSDLIHEKTAGNPFFALQFLTALHENHLIMLDRSARAFVWDTDEIRAVDLADNVVDLVLGKLKKLSKSAQNVLSSLACLGNRADFETLSLAFGGTSEELHAGLDEALRESLVLCIDDSYKFVHDRVEEAAYGLVPPEKRVEAHLAIGRLLYARLPKAALEARVFEVVSQLDRGAALITDPHEKAELRRLNVLAATKAKAAVAYASARQWFAQAAVLLPEDAWGEQYDETFSIFLAWAECEYSSGHFEDADALFHRTLGKARSKADRAAVDVLRMRLYQVSGRYADGVSVALSALALFGVVVPSEEPALSQRAQAERDAIERRLSGHSVADLIDAPVAKDPDVRAIIRLLVEAAPCAYIGRPAVFPLLALSAVRFSLEHGNIEESCFAYSVYGLLLVSVYGDISRAFELSEMSLRLNAKFGDARLRGTLLHLHGDHIHFWKRPFSTGKPILDEAFRACLDVGDFVYAGFLAFETVWQVVEKGDPLDEVLAAAAKMAAFAEQSHNAAVLETLRLEQQFVACLKGETASPICYDDDAGFDERACLAVIEKATFGCGIVTHRIMKQFSAYVFGAFEASLAEADRAAEVLGAAMAMPLEATHHFFRALALAALHDEAPAERRAEIALSLVEITKKFERWAAFCGENFRNRFALLAAELARVLGRDLDAMRGYEEAIRSARENDLVWNEALAREVASRFYEARGFFEIARGFLARARGCYEHWGAYGKVRQIDERHPGLSRDEPRLPTATVAVSAERLDSLSVIKASQTISGEMVLGKLVHTLFEIVLEQSGADRGALVVRAEGKVPDEKDGLVVAATASVDEHGVVTELFENKPLATSRLVPIAVARYVARTHEIVLLDDAQGTPRVAEDPYVAREKPRSLLCLPIVRKAEAIGLLYLENRLAPGVFTPDRLAVLELLASQVAISLENAMLLAKEQEARLSAETALRLRDEFLSIASHELRTPMTSLGLVLQSIERAAAAGKPIDPQSMARLSARAMRQSQRMSTLISDLLDVTRLERGELPLERAEMELGSLVCEVVERFDADATRARCPITVRIPEPIVGVWDRSRLDQVVTNLLSNAIKFGAEKPITVTCAALGDVTTLVVEDQGIGIDPSQESRIFERFGRAVSSRHYGGLGLGLYISRRIVEAHGGTIGVKSRLGEGTRFVVTLPRTPPPAAQGDDGEGKRIP